MMAGRENKTDRALIDFPFGAQHLCPYAHRIGRHREHQTIFIRSQCRCKVMKKIANYIVGCHIAHFEIIGPLEFIFVIFLGFSLLEKLIRVYSIPISESYGAEWCKWVSFTMLVFDRRTLTPHLGVRRVMVIMNLRTRKMPKDWWFQWIVNWMKYLERDKLQICNACAHWTPLMLMVLGTMIEMPCFTIIYWSRRFVKIAREIFLLNNV